MQTRRRMQSPEGTHTEGPQYYSPRRFSQRGRMMPIAMANRNQILRMTCHISCCLASPQVRESALLDFVFHRSSAPSFDKHVRLATNSCSCGHIGKTPSVLSNYYPQFMNSLFPVGAGFINE